MPLEECLGGLQILVDLRSAFDLASRESIAQALEQLPLPSSLIGVLMSWYYVTPYHILHDDLETVLDGNSGVRQGCVAAPFLWTAYVLQWQRRLALTFSKACVLEHVTTYADDHHLAWPFRSIQELLSALSQANMVLTSLADEGMQLSMTKTLALLAIRGTYSRRLVKKITFKEKGVLKLRLGNIASDTGISFPLVQHARYLGVQVSYNKSVSRCTLEHRIRQSKGSFFLLRPWWGSGRLPLRERVRLWKMCIWPSLVFGPYDVGLSPSLAEKFRAYVIRQLRHIAHSPVHLTRENNQSLFKRLQVQDPIVSLSLQTIQHWTKRLTVVTRLSDDDVLHRAVYDLEHHLAEAADYAYWLSFCLHVAFTLGDLKQDSKEVTTLLQMTCRLSKTVMEILYANILTKIQPSQENKRDGLVEVQPIRCSVCDQGFLSLTSLRRHHTRIHGVSEMQGVSPKLDQDVRKLGVDGMPVCPFCSATFKDWRRLSRHMIQDTCGGRALQEKQATLDPDVALQAGHARPVHPGEQLLHHAEHLHLPGHQRPVQPVEHLPRDDDRPVHLQHRVPPGLHLQHSVAGQSCMPLEATRPTKLHCMLDDARLCDKLSHDWREVLSQDEQLKHKLLHHCVLCNMWCPDTTAIKRHQCYMHPVHHKKGEKRYVLLLEGEFLRTRHCRYCGFASKANSEKALNRRHYCGVVGQLAVLLSAHDERSSLFGSSCSGARDDDLQRSHAELGNGTRRQGPRCGGRSQEETAPVRRRCSRKSRPKSSSSAAAPAATEAAVKIPETATEEGQFQDLTRRIAAASDTSISPLHTTRRYAELSPHGYEHDPTYVYRSRWPCTTTHQSGRKVEGTAPHSASHDFKPTASHLVSFAFGGAGYKNQQARFAPSLRSDVAAGSQCEASESGLCIPLQGLESRTAAPDPNRSETSYHRRCSVPSENSHVTDGTRSDPSFSLTEATEPTNVIKDSRFHARDRSANFRGQSCPPALVSVGVECISSVDRSTASPSNSTEIQAMSRDPRADKQDGPLSELEALAKSLATSSSTQTLSSAAGQPTPLQAMYQVQTYVNPDNVCYMNSIIAGLSWCWCCLSQPERLGRLHQLLHHLLTKKTRDLLLDPEYGNRSCSMA